CPSHDTVMGKILPTLACLMAGVSNMANGYQLMPYPTLGPPPKTSLRDSPAAPPPQSVRAKTLDEQARDLEDELEKERGLMLYYNITAITLVNKIVIEVKHAKATGNFSTAHDEFIDPVELAHVFPEAVRHTQKYFSIRAKLDCYESLGRIMDECSEEKLQKYLSRLRYHVGEYSVQKSNDTLRNPVYERDQPKIKIEYVPRKDDPIPTPTPCIKERTVDMPVTVHAGFDKNGNPIYRIKKEKKTYKDPCN
ncbi:MAG TPA: hypothetical protein VKE88_01745, partial [Candidatus Nanoarchaeia archaeon]|nr:hypothetical protein [Candidatus Nanoarchaeia archaeon]